LCAKGKARDRIQSVHILTLNLGGKLIRGWRDRLFLIFKKIVGVEYAGIENAASFML
jgi:hypothetical protein